MPCIFFKSSSALLHLVWCELLPTLVMCRTKIRGPYVVTLLRTLIFEWYIARLVVYDEIDYVFRI